MTARRTAARTLRRATLAVWRLADRLYPPDNEVVDALSEPDRSEPSGPEWGTDELLAAMYADPAHPLRATVDARAASLARHPAGQPRGPRPDLVIVDDPWTPPPGDPDEPFIHITTDPCDLDGCDLTGFHFHWRHQVYRSMFSDSMSPTDQADLDAACSRQATRIAELRRTRRPDDHGITLPPGGRP